MNRQVEMSREIGRLIESALAPPRPMKRYGDETVGALQNVCPPNSHQLREWTRQRPSAFIFDGVDDRA